MFIGTGVGSHEVQAVALAGGHGVAAHGGRAGEFEVDAVPVALDPVVLDGDVSRPPEMNPVPPRRTGPARTGQPVAKDAAAGHALQVDPEECFPNDIVFDPAVMRPVHQDGGTVFGHAGDHAHEADAANDDTVGPDLERVMRPALKDRSALADQLDRDRDHDRGLAIDPGLNHDPIEGPGNRQCLGDGANRAPRSHHDDGPGQERDNHCEVPARV